MARSAIASVVVGLALLIGVPAAWHVSQPEATVGDIPRSSASEQVAASAAERTPESDPGPVFAADPPFDHPEPVDPEPVERPTRISIPAIPLDVPVVPVGLEDDGGMEIPGDVSTIGWYEPGVMPGETGTAVLAGHVDALGQGRGAFWDLRTIDVDDTVSIDHADGATSQWRVVGRTVYPKDELPIADIFTRFGDSRLVLITCGGAFNNATRHYEDNIVVYAEPVELPTPT